MGPPAAIGADRLDNPFVLQTGARREQTMTDRLKGKVAVITGGGSGIGRATALKFLDEGAAVVVADINITTGNETVALARKRDYSEIRFIRADVSRESDVKACIDLAIAEFGRIDCVFNNAGLGGAVGPLTDITVEDWDFTMAMLLRSVFLGLKHGARALKAQGQGGSLISTASIAGLIGGYKNLAYAAAKAGAIQLTKRAAAGLAADRIRVNTIAPGFIVTPLIHRGKEAEVRPFLEKAQPWPDAGEADDVANVAVFLASDESKFITGTAITVDGGVTAVGSDRFNSAFNGFAGGISGAGRDTGNTGI